MTDKTQTTPMDKSTQRTPEEYEKQLMEYFTKKILEEMPEGETKQ